ncbi:MAG: rhomboid family intramembrane serine protease [Candidatus Hadarchaeota archaeon]
MERIEKLNLPTATLVLILINVVVFAAFYNSGTLETAIETWGLKPPAIARGEDLHTLITSSFIHGDLSHLLGNMLYLSVLGYLLERKIGPAKFLIIYFASDLAASVFVLAMAWGYNAVMFGASAAISGIAGACFLCCMSDRIPLGFALMMVLPGLAFMISIAFPATVETIGLYIIFSTAIPILTFVVAPFTTVILFPFLVTWMVFQLGAGLFYTSVGRLAGGIWAHLSGLIAGLLLFLLLIPKGRKKVTEHEAEIPVIG